MHESYNPYLVALSLVVAVLASYTFLELSGRIRRIALTGTKRIGWLLGGAGAMGSGIWSMHFLGMLACRMPSGLRYDPWMSLLALFVAGLVAFFALQLTTQYEVSRVQLAASGILMGSGIASMHYLAMAAIRIQPAIRYRPLLVVASIFIALVASSMALWIALRLRDHLPRRIHAKRCGGALVMGLAIAGMHYVGMSAAIFPAEMSSSAGNAVDTNLLVTLITVLSLFGFTLMLVISRLDSRFDQFAVLSDLSRATSVDGVTGIASRSCFLEQTEDKIAQAQKDGTMLGVIFLDLDGFKTINDSLGHQAGDELLRAFSTDLLKRVRSETLVARLGSDEFVIVLDGIQDIPSVSSIAKAIFARLQTNFHIDKMTLRVTASAGVAIYPQDGDSVASLLKSANMAMNRAKQQGKNVCRFFTPAMGEAASKALHINRSLGEALEKNQFSLVYQPKFDGRKNRVTGAEALIRWVHPVAGNIPPLDFIPVAEETGQIVQISEWVIQEVCRQLKAWESMGLPPTKVAINLSPEQLRQERYAERIAAMVHASGVNPRSILFEITETAAMREPKRAVEMIREFQQAGFEFAIDDFGTGYSSMAYLQQFRVKELKIDRFFISSLESGGEEEHTIVSAIIALAHALHMTVVAEGVETSYQLKMLKNMDCDEIQGYLLGRPMSPTNFEKLLAEEIGYMSGTVSPSPDGPPPQGALHSALA